MVRKLLGYFFGRKAMKKVYAKKDVMYNSELFRLTAKGCKVSLFFGALPFDFDPDKELIFVTENGKLKSLANWLAMTLYVCLFVPYQVYNVRQSKDFKSFNYLIINWICAINGITILTIINFQAEETAVFINATLQFVKNFSRQYMPTYDAETAAENRKLIKYIKALWVYQMALAFAFSSHYFRYPQSPLYVTSEVEKQFMNPFLYFSYGFFYARLVFTSYLTFNFLLVILLVQHYLFVPIYATEFRLGSPPGQRSTDELRSIQQFPRMYRSLELITKMQNQVISLGFIPLQTGFWGLDIFIFLALNRYWMKLHRMTRLVLAVFSLGCTIFWSIMLKIYGNMGVMNKQTRASWKRAVATEAAWHGYRDPQKDRAYMKRFQRSCRPIYVAHGNFFVVKPITVLNFLRKASWGALKALLMTRKIK